MPVFMDSKRAQAASGRTFWRPALIVAAVLLGFPGAASAEGDGPSPILWAQPETPAGAPAGVESYQLDFLTPRMGAPMGMPLAPAARGLGSPLVSAPLENADAMPNPGARDESAGRAPSGGSYSLADAVREAGWRKVSAERVRRAGSFEPRF